MLSVAVCTHNSLHALEDNFSINFQMVLAYLISEMLIVK